RLKPRILCQRPDARYLKPDARGEPMSEKRCSNGRKSHLGAARLAGRAFEWIARRKDAALAVDARKFGRLSHNLAGG
ncbi:hypothetical protein, partial [Sodalis sp.]|uniref:hypothetical protein n=1 Tax=Sodalis sp. (in: enterobacteria) TaxID=1898979 RepID=UPI003872F392